MLITFCKNVGAYVPAFRKGKKKSGARGHEKGEKKFKTDLAPHHY
jgi:hypothetical protein